MDFFRAVDISDSVNLGTLIASDIKEPGYFMSECDKGLRFIGHIEGFGLQLYTFEVLLVGLNGSRAGP